MAIVIRMTSSIGFNLMLTRIYYSTIWIHMWHYHHRWNEQGESEEESLAIVLLSPTQVVPEYIVGVYFVYPPSYHNHGTYKHIYVGNILSRDSHHDDQGVEGLLKYSQSRYVEYCTINSHSNIPNKNSVNDMHSGYCLAGWLSVCPSFSQSFNLSRPSPP